MIAPPQGVARLKLVRNVRRRALLQGRTLGNRQAHEGARRVSEKILRLGHLSGLGQKDPTRRRDHFGARREPRKNRSHHERGSVLFPRPGGRSNHPISREPARQGHAQKNRRLTQRGIERRRAATNALPLGDRSYPTSKLCVSPSRLSFRTSTLKGKVSRPSLAASFDAATRGCFSISASVSRVQRFFSSIRASFFSMV